MPATYKLIQTVTVGVSGSATIDFTSIPQTYTDLSIFISGRCSSSLSTSGVAYNLTINSSTANKAYKRFYAVGGSAGSDSPSTARLGVAATTSTATTSVFDSIFIYFTNYTSSANKVFLVDGVAENNSTTLNELDVTGGVWSVGSAITSLSFSLSDSSNFLQYSSASLYGIKNS